MRPVRILGPLTALWSVLIVASTLTTGWHYLVDIIAGVAVAFGAHFFVERFVLDHIADRTPAPSLFLRSVRSGRNRHALAKPIHECPLDQNAPREGSSAARVKRLRRRGFMDRNHVPTPMRDAA